MRDRTLVLSVLIVASCGLGYELIAGALSSYLLGDSILQFSSIIGCYLFAMGVGSWLSRYVKDEDVLARFVDIEILVGLLGGVSAALLFVVFAWLSAPFRAALYALVFVIGLLVGMEIPLVMRIFNARRASFSELVSRVLTFDYLGALAVSLVFPLLLAPRLGLSRTGFLFGMCNAAVALFTTRVFRAELPDVAGRTMRAMVVIALLGAGFAGSARLTHWAERGLFGDEIIHSETTPYQRLVITRWKDDLRLYINGNLQFSSRDEHRYHEALVHPALQALPWARRVLVIGGGDGLAAREILRHRQIEHITLVDLDPAMTMLFSRSAPLRALNRDALRDPRLHVVNADAAQWLEQNTEVFDAIIVDLPDPSNFGLGKLYSVPMYRLLAHHLAEKGYAVIQSTSPYYAPRSFWDIDATLREAGFHTWPYHAYVPSFGEWGFILAGKRSDYTPPTRYDMPMRFLDAASTALMFRFPADMAPRAGQPNRLNEQTLVHDFEQDWRDVIR
ncbi:polyamine aminopropyltransferase [Cupriavidus malaysiensis]|uniref:Polyamine aminopropyltransferase n=1 Tax=Cupriavidus malaysiensis TaxID=367825 RepID=A0ABN4TN45_9BURK|nr:polyamine aminopropyltransferase [Cupriavidus malaysiensis]AOZ06081.1 spermidine synthase [Cupriavidus malaysiensis]